MITLTLTGMTEVTQHLQRLVPAPIAPLGQALYEEGNRIMGQSVQLVPVDRHFLAKKDLHLVCYAARPLTYWRREDLFIRPSSTVTFYKNSVPYMKYFTPFTQTMRLIVQRQKYRIPCVTRLLCSCSPSAIVRRIRPIIVGIAVQRMRWRGTQPHVVKKCRERLLPLGANGNTSSSIAGIISAHWAQAPLFHLLPTTIFRSYPSLPRATMLHIPFCLMFAFPASTTSRVFVAQASGGHRCLLPTATLTDPRYPFLWNLRRRVTMEYGQTSKRLASQIKKIRCRLVAQTATASYSSFAQLIRAYCFEVSTHTLTYPQDFTSPLWAFWGLFHCGQQAEGLSSQVNKICGWHRLPSHAGRWLTSGYGIAASVSACFRTVVLATPRT